MARTATPSPKPPARRKRGFERAATLVAGDLRGPAEKRGFAEARLLTHWPEIVGAEIAEIALPVRITYGRGFGGTLVLLTTGANAPILEMRREDIVVRVNACYGYRAVSRVQVTQTAPTGFAEGRVAFAPKPKPGKVPPDPERLERATAGLTHIEDEGLRNALAALARNVLTNRQT
ncbi:hypothetical protein roselon_00869 [Roseibacterium elongatum DSM 19469]|uniref:Zn-ribbon-containing protein n=1 Tax=Roseicyclus elongatus DSM 19469 TaxID=1294273 RepID=W8RQ30_9RHOB|nr:DUF721 domain-containing protein [Roseibacterium elongatum]AHM03279.1 hypothetical protein roselon_00869 [Roseibacterium elongatum DSM 19469]